jgi:hypothetical protein
MMNDKDIAAADKRYNKDNWSEVEKLVLYRLDACENTIVDIRDSLITLTAKQALDAKVIRQERLEQYNILKEGIQEIRDTYAQASLKRAETGKLRVKEDAAVGKLAVEKDTVIRIEQARIEGRLDRLEKIIYGFLGGGGMVIIGALINSIL